MKTVRPRIALTLSRPTPLHQASHQRYRDALERVGADVVALHPGDAMPEDVDALCLSGGGDIEPSRYGEEDIACSDVDTDRDSLELTLARNAIDRDLPFPGTVAAFRIRIVRKGGGSWRTSAGTTPGGRWVLA